MEKTAPAGLGVFFWLGALLGTASPVAAQSITWLPWPSWPYFSQSSMTMRGVSPDGVAFTGEACCNMHSGYNTFLYRPGSGYTLLREGIIGYPNMVGGGNTSAGGVFALYGGNVGSYQSPIQMAFRYPSPNLGGLTGEPNPGTYASGISDDGSVVVGGSLSGSGQSHAYLWTLARGMVDLGLPLDDDQTSGAWAVSPDGSIVVGISTGPAGVTLFRWTAATGMTPLATLPTDPNRYLVAAGAGSATFVGYNTVGGHAIPFRWTPATGMRTLPLAAGHPDATPRDVSDDGTKVVGVLDGSGDNAKAFLWTPSTGTVELQAYLQHLGVQMPNLPTFNYLVQATSISNDGRHVGGITASWWSQRVWIAHLPLIRSCGSADFDCDNSPGTDADIEAFFACLAGDCPSCFSSADFNFDGDSATDADIEAFFRVLAGGSC